MRRGRPGTLVDRLQSHHAHQPSNPMTPDDHTFTVEGGPYLAAAEERIQREQPVDRFHDRQRGRINDGRPVVER